MGYRGRLANVYSKMSTKYSDSFNEGGLEIEDRYSGEIKNMKYAMIEKWHSGKIPELTIGVHVDAFDIIKTDANKIGVLEHWNGSCESKEKSYTYNTTCCLDSNCNKMKNVTLKYKFICNITRKSYKE